MNRRLSLLLLVSIVALPLFAAEGKWTPQQVLELDPAWLKQQGLELPPSRLWDANRGTGLLAAAISTGGCSGGFISAEGLFITNHHCLFGVLQEHATPQNDIITHGFLARSRDQEIRSKTMRITIPTRFTDVTGQVLAAVPPNAGDAERFRAIERKSNEILAACEAQPGARCRVAAHDGGVQYVLQETREIADVRLVYAPPRAVGEFGGEIDNWMWPRHTGDFAIGRAWVDGKPFRPEFYYPLAKKGIAEGDFVMILGYPGTTYRALTADEMEERHIWFTRRADAYREWIDLLERATEGSPEGTIAVADIMKTLANRQKNAEGQLAGFARGRIVESRRTSDGEVLRNAEAKAAYAGLAKMAAEKKDTFDHDFLLDHLTMTRASLTPTGPKPLVLALAVARVASQLQKPDADRDPTFMERNIGRVRERVEREQKNLFPAADKAFLAAFVKRALALPKGQRIAAIDQLFAGPGDDASIRKRIDDLYAQTKVFDLGERMKMLGETPAQLHARRDPLVEAGFLIDRDVRELLERKDRWEGTISRLRPIWRRAVVAHAGKPLAPDANSTLRVSFGHVKGYTPRDGVRYLPQTTLSGVVEKQTGREPFDVPEKILRAARAPSAPDIPVAFLADGDTTGGNSGSPVINGRGELVGVNFDRVWENVANDFAYLPDVGRNISADMRYMLWILEEVEGANELLRELGLRP